MKGPTKDKYDGRGRCGGRRAGTNTVCTQHHGTHTGVAPQPTHGHNTNNTLAQQAKTCRGVGTTGAAHKLWTA